MAKPRVRKLLDLRTDTPEFLEALDSLGDLPESRRHNARRHLRYDLEQKSLESIEKFVLEAEKVHVLLLACKQHVFALDGECGKALEDLEKSENATSEFVLQSTRLKKALDEAEERAKTVSAFLQKFQLTGQEIEALKRGQEKKPDASFFAALERVRRIRDECSELLSGTHQSSGLEIFEQMAAHQSKAQDVVYAWIKKECADGSAGRELETEIKRTLYAKAFAEFKTGSPAYYSHCVELVSKARRAEVSKKFAQIVYQKQMDHLAVDPIRHLSDLLTSLHEVCAEERDLYQSVFHTSVGSSQKNRFLASPTNEDDTVVMYSPSKSSLQSASLASSPKAFSPSHALVDENVLDPAEQQECLERALSGISNTLRSRGAQLIETMHDSVVCFRTMQVLDFYAETISCFFPLASTNSEEDNPIHVVKQLKTQSKWRFLHLVEEKASELSASARTRALPGSDLSASFEVLELVRYLRDVLSAIRDRSLGSGGSGNSAANSEEALEALNAYAGPIRHLIQAADNTFSNRADSSIFAVNNLVSLQGVLTLHDFTAQLVEELSFEIGERIDQLAKYRSDAALARTGLFAQAIVLLDKVPAEQYSRLSEQPGFRAEQVKAAFDSFYRDLSGSLVMPEFDRIDAPRLRAQARNATCTWILNAHNRLYDAVKKGGYADTSFLIHSKEQVADLLDV